MDFKFKVSERRKGDPRMELPKRRRPLHENDGFMFWLAITLVVLFILLCFGGCYWALWIITKMVTG